MANSLLTINDITRMAVALWKNSNAFIQNIDQQYDDSFAQTGAKIGTTLRIRLPNDYVVRTGAAASVQDTAEQSTTLVLATQKGVDVSFNSVDRTMSLMDYSERVMSPAINNLTGAVAADIIGGSEGGVCNFVSLVDGSSNIIHPTATTYLNGGALLHQNSAPLGVRKIVNNPFTEASAVATFTTLFNPANKISKQYESGTMGTALGFDWFMDQTVINHTSGTFTAGTVAGGGQTGTTLTVNAITGTLKAGDFITLALVNAVNPITKQSTGTLRQFTLTADAASGATSLSIFPAIIPAVGGNAVQYQTTTISPADTATILLLTKPSEVYRKNIAYARQAVTMAVADLIVPGGVMEASRVTNDGVSLRMVTQYQVGTDQLITRLDVLYGSLWVRPQWACVVADSVS